jgi:hypothetical protein
MLSHWTWANMTTREARQAGFDHGERQSVPVESRYDVRVLQEDGQLAWSSPIWIRQRNSHTEE